MIGLSVNISPRRLEDPGLLEELRRIDPSRYRLSFELVETIWFDGLPAAVKQRLQNFKEMGIGIELDDFGAGHASITGLLKLGADTVKIDRRLVADIATDRKASELLRSIVNMLKSLDFSVVAEGVETAEQFEQLISLGCCALQGFGLARPMGHDALMTYLAHPTFEIDVSRGQLALSLAS